MLFERKKEHAPVLRLSSKHKMTNMIDPSRLHWHVIICTPSTIVLSREYNTLVSLKKVGQIEEKTPDVGRREGPQWWQLDESIGKVIIHKIRVQLE